jgi:hypothetical protein
MTFKTEVLRQMDNVLAKYHELQSRSQYEDCSDQPGIDTTGLITLMSDTIKRFSPPHSQYVESTAEILKKYGVSNEYVIPRIAGVLKALRDAHDAGYLVTVAELIHADLSADFLEMAEYLLSEGYKDPAAVVVGSLLEEHLRQLCAKNGIATAAAGRAKKADQLNADLAGNLVYSKLDQKSITAWLDLRNKAAHGKYGEYSQEQVTLLIQGVRDFMTRVPA